METPELQWFAKQEFKCSQCGRRADGTLMGRHNESYGLHCQRCADRRLAEAKKVRKQENENG